MTKGPSLFLLGYNIFEGKKEFFNCELAGVINTLNPHSYIIARKDKLFHKALQASDYLIADGVGIVMAVKFIKGKKIERITGSDLHAEIIRNLSEKDGKCFYLGSSETTLLKIKARLSSEFPSVISGSFSPPFREIPIQEDTDEMITAVNQFAPDVLFVGMGAPKQEKWVFLNRERLNVKLICCIGAAFDFYAGTIKRSGRFWIKTGLEWLPRLLREPVRLWRRNFISTPLFIWYVLREKFRIKNIR